MKNISIMGYMTLAVLIGMGLILMLNFSRLFTQQKNERYLSYNGVRGLAVEHKRQLWTLNFEQQNRVIEYLNLALPVGKNSQRLEKKALDFDRLVVYRFKGPALFLTPIGYTGDNLVFESKELHPTGHLLDISAGALNTLLKETYDP